MKTSKDKKYAAYTVEMEDGQDGYLLMYEIIEGWDFTIINHYGNIIGDGATLSGTEPLKLTAKKICNSHNMNLGKETDYDEALQLHIESVL